MILSVKEFKWHMWDGNRNECENFVKLARAVIKYDYK